jgi:tetratricopeptide (TPR) repeat protein
MRGALPSDFPAALGALDESDLPVVSAGLPAISAGLPAMRGAPPAKAPPPAPSAPKNAPPPPPAPKKGNAFADIDLDLPVVSADLPVVSADLPMARPAATKAPAPPAARASFDIDLPARASDLPTVKKNDDLVDLPSIAAGLPVVSADLPVPAASLPVAAGNLPVVAASLPAVASSLPVVAASLPVPASALPVVAARGFGEIDLPNVAEVLPTAQSPDQQMPARVSGGHAAFGEIDLPRERPASSAPPAPADNNSADFGDLQLGDRPHSARGGHSVAAHVEPTGNEGTGLTFGEVDFGGNDAPRAGGIGVETSGPGVRPRMPDVGGRVAATAPISARGRPAREPGRRSYGKLVAGGLFIALLLGGGALQLTSYGAFGYLAIGDKMHESDYAQATSAAVADAEKTLGSDTYDAAKTAADAAYAAHTRTPRGRALTAYAAVVDAEVAARFGADPTRTSRVKQLLAEVPPGEPVKYLDIAQAAQSAADGELDKARRGLDAASRRDPGDRIQVDVALLRGGVELAARDGAAALAAFKQALSLSADARAHFGLARAYALQGDSANARKELDATLASSPSHPGALIMRARMDGVKVDPDQALADLGKVIDGPGRAKASPDELSRAYAAKAWVDLDRGAASEAREAFAQAVKINPRNLEALNGEGRLLLSEGRFTEALARFDTALQYDPTSVDAIANDAEAKIGLERLADAKQQLLDAKQKFPKSIPILLLLGKVEQNLGNKDAAEADLRSALAFVDPTRLDAVLPYVALSELLSARGRLTDASAVLEDARKKLPASATLDRAFGEVAEAQGQYDTAITDYRSALEKDPKDVATHFHLAVALRRVRKFDLAATELDSVAAVDKDYPGLSLERGLLYEEAGDIEKAIDQFKSALAKAPDDPDLQLRVGSAYVAIGRPDDALPMLRKVMRSRPTSAEANHYIGRALMLKGRTEQVDALRYLQKAVDLDPNRAEYHVYLAWEANEAQPAKMDLARDEVEKALALDKLNPEAYWQRGILERIEGAFDLAIGDERRALELRPSRYEAHATLAECFDAKNDQATSAAEWTKAIAGDGKTTSADGTVPHPYWRYAYGKLLMDRGNTAAALPLLVAASLAAEKMDQRPGWFAPAEFLAAEALRKSGRRADAIEHYKRFLDVAPLNSPDRADAQKALASLNPPR